MRYLILFILAIVFFVGTQVKAQKDSISTSLRNNESLANDSSTNQNTPKIDIIGNALVKSISEDASLIQVERNDSAWTLAVKTSDLKTSLKSFAKNDKVDITFSQSKGGKELKTILVKTQQNSVSTRIWTLIGVALGLLFFSWLLIRQSLSKLILGLDNRYSNSKFQIVIWFFLLIVAYIATNILRSRVSIDFIGGVNIPSNLLMLSGLSALTFATAKGITESKVEEAKKEGVVDPKPLPTTGPKFPSDLFTDDAGNIDMADFQMIIITLLAVVTYIVQVFGFLASIEFHKNITLPDVDTTILATFGLGQEAYLAKKFVSKVGS